MPPSIRMVSVPPNVLESIAFNLCSLHDFDPAYVQQNERFALATITEYLRAQPAAAPVREEGGAVLSVDDVPVWADGIVTDGERVAMAQKAEADHGGTYWAVDGGDGGLDWEPTHFISLTTLATREEAPAEAGEDFRAQVVKLLDELIAHIVAIGPDKPDLNTPMLRRVWREVFADLITALHAQPQAREEAQPVARLRPVVLAFAHVMEAKLKENDWKRGWKKDTALSLMARLREETNELDERVQARARFQVAINPPPAPRLHELIANEAADVANFAMMVADVCGGLPERAVRSIAESATPPAPEAEKLREALHRATYVLTSVQSESSDSWLVKDAGVALEALAALQARDPA